MTNDHAHDSRVSLADDPNDHVAAYIAAFNTGSAEALDEVYEANAVVFPRPGHPMAGSETPPLSAPSAPTGTRRSVSTIPRLMRRWQRGTLWLA